MNNRLKPSALPKWPYPNMAAYWPDEAQRLAAENRELRATLRRRDREIGCYQVLSIVAVLGWILLAMGV